MRRSNSLVCLPLSLFLLVASGCAPRTVAEGPAGDAAAKGAPVKPDPAQLEAAWKEIDRLVDEQKMQAALDRLTPLLAAAEQGGDAESWARALIRRVQLSSALSGFETAVRELSQAPWPEAPRERAVLHLFYGQALYNYLAAYSWEIGQRERVVTSGEVDLKAWTREQIRDEAERSYAEVFRRRDAWGTEPIGKLAEHIEQNTYPARIRGTLRDAVTYLWVELLANTAWWSPEESNEAYRLGVPRLLGPAPLTSGEQLTEPASHPLAKIAFVLEDLEAWHRAGERPEAAFEARLERLRRLRAALTQPADRALLQADLEQATARLGRRYEWWSVGQAELAEILTEESGAWSLVAARERARAGAEAYPESHGGRRCENLVRRLDAPELAVSAMRFDAAGKRSIAVDHKNLPGLHLRAYRLDAEALLTGTTPALVPLLTSYQLTPGLLERGRPVAEWRLELPATPDLRAHRTYLVPPVGEPGIYVIAASAERDFRQNDNVRLATLFVVTDLVLSSEWSPGRVLVTALSGSTGKPVAGAEVRLLHGQPGTGQSEIARGKTDREGRLELATTRGYPQTYSLLAQNGRDLAFQLNKSRWEGQPPTEATTAALLFTDRTVYRPLQKVQWKLVPYRRSAEGDRFETLPKVPGTVQLLDANGEVVASEEVTTNAFGSAAGSFAVPAGRLLGSWRLTSSLGGDAAVVVEEYKRPTFEVALDDPAEALRLNRKARFTGTSRYYFGLPTTGASARWVLTREPVYPPWGWWWSRAVAGPQIVASGTSPLDADGRFEVELTPEGDEREAGQAGLSYRFRLSADVTDEGGETRSAERSFRLGFVSIEASLEAEERFFVTGEPAKLTLLRRDLDSIARAGSGSWKLLRLVEPAAPVLPADQPVPEAPTPSGEKAPHRTPGDALRPRWEAAPDVETVLASWATGSTVREGKSEHGTDGRAQLDLAGLPAGAYRLVYETFDAFGGRAEASRNLLVVAPSGTPLALPIALLAQRPSIEPGGKARFLVGSGFAEQELELLLEWRRPRESGNRLERRRWRTSAGAATAALGLLELPIGPEHRGGLSARLLGVRDHQSLAAEAGLTVPWVDRELRVEFATFRDRLRPGQKERWRVTVRGADDKAVGAGAAEVLGYMYDRSLDLFAPHEPPRVPGLYPNLQPALDRDLNLGAGWVIWSDQRDFVRYESVAGFAPDRLRFLDNVPIGGPGQRSGRMMKRSAMAGGMPPPAPAAAMPEGMAAEAAPAADLAFQRTATATSAAPPAAAAPRQNFAESAFFLPHLLTAADGSVTFELEVPESLTEWSVWAHAVTRDLAGGAVERRTRTVKELMVRPYLPRFLRERDQAEVRLVVSNAGEAAFEGTLDFDIQDPETGASQLADFGLDPRRARGLPFRVAPGASATVTVPLTAPARVGEVAVEVVARAGELSDGERRPLPLLPSRLHLAQSRFAALSERGSRTLTFSDLARRDDPTLASEQLVVTLDAQLFYSLLSALPYLIDYPYECTEQTLNRYLSTAMLGGLFERYPSVAKMAAELAQRETPLEAWQEADPNRKIALEETPWRIDAAGGRAPGNLALIKVLDPEVTRTQREASLAKLVRSQDPSGGFPWWPGGPPSPYMTLYLLYGFAKGLEFGIEPPQDLVNRAWGYLQTYYLDEVARRLRKDEASVELVTFLGYVLSAYPDESWTAGAFSAGERKEMLEYSWRRWKKHSPLLKSYLALTLHRAGRSADARLVFDSVMDSARSTPEEGVFWQPEDRAWLWYNDTIESHAFALRTLTELAPGDARRHGLVQWLFLNKKLNHWKSTRATAEVLYSVARHLMAEGQLEAREEATVRVGRRSETFRFEPDRYTGKNVHLVVPGAEVDAERLSEVVVEKPTKGLLFASATWHFATDKLPEQAEGDLFRVERRFWKRVQRGKEWQLEPLAEGTRLAAGDQLEVELALSARAPAEYVHLRDPRGAGFEPEQVRSGYRWDLGVAAYEEVRDTGTNFFFEALPAGQYTLRYRLRAATGGTFRVGPATLQSMYAPEFTAYSTGAKIRIEGGAAP
jgi:alpha-2-macroglobulin